MEAMEPMACPWIVEAHKPGEGRTRGRGGSRRTNKVRGVSKESALEPDTGLDDVKSMGNRYQ